MVRSTRPAQRARLRPTVPSAPRSRPVSTPRSNRSPPPPLDQEVARLVGLIRTGTTYALCACLAALVLAVLAVTL